MLGGQCSTFQVTMEGTQYLRGEALAERVGVLGKGGYIGMGLAGGIVLSLMAVWLRGRWERGRSQPDG